MDQRFIKNISDIQTLMQHNNKMMLPPIIINLEKDTDRREKITSHLKTFGIGSYIFAAVKSTTIPVTSLTPSETACCLSHAAVLRCYQHVLDPKLERIAWLVLEDDARFLVNPLHAVMWVILNIKTDWSIISLGCYNGEFPEIDDNSYRLETSTNWMHWGSHAYLVNPKHARRIMLDMSELLYPIDHILIREIHAGKGYIMRPSISYQETFDSNVREGEKRNFKRLADLLTEDKDFLLSLEEVAPDP